MAAEIHAALTILASQDVHVTGGQTLAAKPAWGSGDITVDDLGRLALANLVVSGSVTMEPGAVLSVDAVDFDHAECRLNDDRMSHLLGISWCEQIWALAVFVDAYLR